LISSSQALILLSLVSAASNAQRSISHVSTMASRPPGAPLVAEVIFLFVDPNIYDLNADAYLDEEPTDPRADTMKQSVIGARFHLTHSQFGRLTNSCPKPF
jgi:hypothetical protein